MSVLLFLSHVIMFFKKKKKILPQSLYNTQDTTAELSVAGDEVDLESVLGHSWRPLYSAYFCLFVCLVWFQTQSTSFLKSKPRKRWLKGH